MSEETATAESLIERAKAGERLNADDRRQCISWLLISGTDMSNVDMGEMFQVSEAAIRKDKLTVRESVAEEIEQDDIRLTVADIKMNFDCQLRDLKKGKKKTAPGTKLHLDYCKAILYMDLERVKAFQALGILPSNVGSMTINEYNYAAIVTKGDSVDTRRLEEFDEATQKRIKDRRKALPPPKKGSEEVIDIEPQRRIVQPVQ